MSAGRYVGGAFRVGQTISVDGVHGEIVAVENAVTVLRTIDGTTVRVPNHLFLESVVTLHDEGEGGPVGASPVWRFVRPVLSSR